MGFQFPTISIMNSGTKNFTRYQFPVWPHPKQPFSQFYMLRFLSLNLSSPVGPRAVVLTLQDQCVQNLRRQRPMNENRRKALGEWSHNRQVYLPKVIHRGFYYAVPKQNVGLKADKPYPIGQWSPGYTTWNPSLPVEVSGQLLRTDTSGTRSEQRGHASSVWYPRKIKTFPI